MYFQGEILILGLLTKNVQKAILQDVVAVALTATAVKQNQQKITTALKINQEKIIERGIGFAENLDATIWKHVFY